MPQRAGTNKNFVQILMIHILCSELKIKLSYGPLWFVQLLVGSESPVAETSQMPMYYVGNW